MELPRGLQKSLPTPKKEVTEIKCPVVEKYKRRGHSGSLYIPEPSNIGLKYNSNLPLEELKKFWILSALKESKGCFSRAARMLGIGRETVYRLVRELRDK